MKELLSSKNHEKNISFEDGYKKGMEDAVKQGFAHPFERSDNINYRQGIEDILRMLYIIHEENKIIVRTLVDPADDLIDAFEEAVRNEIESYDFGEDSEIK